jgi:hypothetical protein
MSGITQFKLASMGNRFAPIVNQLSHLDSDRHTPHSKGSFDMPIAPKFRKSTEYQGIIEPRKSFSYTRPMLGLPVEKKPIDLGVNIKSLINKFSMNPEGKMEIIVENPIQQDEKKDDEKKDDEKKDSVEEVKIDVNEIKIEEPKVPVEIPKLDLENIKREEEERQNNSSKKRKSSSRKTITPKEPVFIFKDEDEN